MLENPESSNHRPEYWFPGPPAAARDDGIRDHRFQEWIIWSI